MIGPGKSNKGRGGAGTRSTTALTELSSEQDRFWGGGTCGPDSERSAVGGRANAAEPFWLEWGHGPDDSGLSVNFDRDVIAHR